MPFSFISNILNATATRAITLVYSSSWSTIAVVSAVALTIPAYQIYRGYMIRFRTHSMLKSAFLKPSKKEFEDILSSKCLTPAKKAEVLIQPVDLSGNNIVMSFLESMRNTVSSTPAIPRDRCHSFCPAFKELSSEQQFRFLSRQNISGYNVIMLAIQNKDAALAKILITMLGGLTPDQKYIILTQVSDQSDSENLLIQSVRSEISPKDPDSNEGIVESLIAAAQGLTLEKKLALLNITNTYHSMAAQNFARHSERLTKVLADFEFSYEAVILQAGAVLRQLSSKTRMPADIVKLLVTFIDSGPQAACLLTGFNRAKSITMNRSSAGTVQVPAMRFVASVADEDSTEERKYPPCLHQRFLK